MMRRDYQSYSWTRYWSLLGQEPSQAEDLFSRYTGTGSARSGQPLHNLTNEKCQVLLGEAGSGKTDELCQLKEHLDAEGKQVESIDLGDFGEPGLIRSLETTLRKEGPIYLLLDGLDETSIRNPPELLRREIGDEHEGEIYLRVACRSAYWAFRSSEFQAGLSEVFPEVDVYEIEPLSKEDVLLAAKEEGISAPQDFWSAVKEVGAESLTRKPVTLKFLFDEYSIEEGDLPSTRTKLYRSACHRLCKEVDPSRIETSQLDKQERLRLSERMAAVSMFSQRKRIWVSPRLEDAPEGSLSIEDFITATEYSRREHSYREVIEATNTGLLHGGTPSEEKAQSVEWVERTLAEFLAARFVTRQELSLGELLDLLAAPEDERRGIAPQMQDIAGWVSRWQDEMFEHLLQTDPHVVLLGDVAALSPEKRSRLSARLLQQYDRRRLRPTDAWKFGTQHLSNPDLPSQLREYLKPEHHADIRSVAINLIQQNGVESLSDEVVQIALADDEPLRLRVSSAHALGVVGEEETLQKLIPLLRLGEKEDPERELRGSVLSAVYPDILSAEDVLPDLPPPREKDSRTYVRFIERDFFEGVDATNLISVFERFEDWLQLGSSSETGETVRIPRILEPFVDELFLTASSNLSDEEIRSRLAGWIYTLTKNYQELPGRGPTWNPGFYEKWGDSKSLRATVLSEILTHDDPEYVHMSRGSRALLPKRDLELVLKKARDEEKPEKEKRWAKLGRYLFRCDQIGSVVPYLQIESVREAFMDHIGKPSYKEGPQVATEALRQHCKEKERQRKEKSEQQDQLAGEDEETRVTPGQVEGVLDASETLDGIEKWPSVYNLILRDVGGGDDISDLTEREVWKQAGSRLRRRLITAAFLYLEESQPDPAIWKTSSSVWGEREFTTVAALRLLQSEVPHRLEDRGEEMWKKWAPLVVAYKPVTDEDHSAIQRLAARAYDRVPAVVEETLRNRVQVRSEDPENPGSVPALRNLEDLWDDRLIGVLTETAQDPGIHARTLSEVVPVILEHGEEEDLESVESLLDEVNADQEDGWRRSAEVAIAMVRSPRRRKVWDKIWTHVKSHDDFAHRVVARLADRSRSSRTEIVDSLESEELSALYLRLVELYPHEEDVEREAGEAHWVTTRDEIQSFRKAVLQTLTDRGAAQQVEQIREVHPNLEWLIQYERQAEEEARRRAWSPHAPEDVLELANRKKARLGRSGPELFGAVKDALEDLEEELRGDTSAVYDLWSSITRNRTLHLTEAIVENHGDEMSSQLEKGSASETLEVLEAIRKPGSSETYRVPKGEMELSDYVQRYLQRVLEEAVVSREVSVDPGNYTDLYISTFIRGENEEEQKASVVVEVKGSWNSKVYKGIQEQLVERYLTEASSRFGVYFVGWHFCEAWSDSDPRRKRARRGGLESHEEKLSERIEELDEEGLMVCQVVADLSLPD